MPFGVPRTNEERRKRHLARFGTSKLPPRGTKYMPLPKTTDIGEIMRELKTSRRKRPRKQMVAIALSHARKMGAKIPKK